MSDFSKKRSSVLVALSGGVDSSVAAILLKEQGYNLVGVTLKMAGFENYRNPPLNQGIKDAQLLADRLKIPYYVIDIKKEFEQKIIAYFINEYKNGKTPNPCALCNFSIKWTKLLELADEFGCEHIATGHYAKINHQNGRYYITKAQDGSKDQSFFLWRLSQEGLRRTIFPLSNYPKNEIKELARINGIHSIANKSESYTICFIPDGNYRAFLKNKLPDSTGAILDRKGNCIGQHNGIWNYTIGQKKGLEFLKNSSYSVIVINPIKNEIVVGDRTSNYSKEIIIGDIVYSKYTSLKDKMLFAKHDYRSQLEECTVKEMNDERVVVCFEKPTPPLSPGQSIVFFEGNDLVAGGVIDSILL